MRGTGVPVGFRHLDGAGSRFPTGGGGGVETPAAATSSGGDVAGVGSSKVRGRGEGEAWGSGGTRSPGGAELPGNQTPSPRARRMAGEAGVTSGSTRDVRRESEERSEACSFREPPPADGSDCTFPISGGGRRLWSEKPTPGLWGRHEVGHAYTTSSPHLFSLAPASSCSDSFPMAPLSRHSCTWTLTSTPHLAQVPSLAQSCVLQVVPAFQSVLRAA